VRYGARMTDEASASDDKVIAVITNETANHQTEKNKPKASSSDQRKRRSAKGTKKTHNSGLLDGVLTAIAEMPRDEWEVEILKDGA
jgi:hypothetical protein